MCNHFKVPKSLKAAELAFDAIAAIEQDIAFPDTFLNGFDHPDTLIILDKKPEEIILGQWGLIPAWGAAKPQKEFYKTANTLNARIEEVREKRTYKDYVENRCLILTDKFKEWKHLPGIGKAVNKIPYSIGMPDDSLFAMAGIYSEVNGHPTYTILTTAANELMAEIHNSAKRMPVILSKEEEKLWLNRDDKNLMPYHARTEIELKAIPLINNAAGQASLF